MNEQKESKKNLREDLKKLQKVFLRSIKDIDAKRRIQLKQELAIALRGISLQNEEKAKRAAELIIAHLEIKFLNEEKAKRASELVIANIELVFQNNEKSKREAELFIATKELMFQNEEKAKRAAELVIANIELVFQNKEKSKRAAELVVANKKLIFQNREKEKRAAELIIANKELLFQNGEKEKRAAELTQLKENAEESDRLKSAFLANMSHEIRTPMNGILGFADLLREPQLTGEVQQEYIRIIRKSGARMLNIINDIISISKIESGLMEANIQELNINHNIKFIYKFFKVEIERKGIRFLFKNALSGKEAFIKSDGEKIYSILTNLVKNAIKHTEEGTIELGYVLKKEKDPSDFEVEFLEFYVKDTGVGIPKERQMAIFERFTQSDISNKTASQGAGLGLSISRAYVEMLGGRIWVDSEQGKGSTFYFTLPYGIKPQKRTSKKQDVRSKRPEKIANPKAFGLRILIVEDDKISRMLLTLLVKEYSSVVFEARTGVEAVAIARNNPDIDLILMDIQMPELNGYEATQQIRQFNNKVVIIVQTACSLSDDKEGIIRIGCDDYILKPINKDKLFSLVQMYFQK